MAVVRRVFFFIVRLIWPTVIGLYYVTILLHFDIQDESYMGFDWLK